MDFSDCIYSHDTFGDSHMYLAQFNAARVKYPMSHPLMSEFVENLEGINNIARTSRGFVWKLQDESGHSANIRTAENPDMAINLSVWDSIENLIHFLEHSEHKYFLANRRKWFHPHGEAHSVLWWIAEDAFPSLDEAWRRLTYLRTHGVTPVAFTFSCVHSPDGYPV